jgi:hypothetical protein
LRELIALPAMSDRFTWPLAMCLDLTLFLLNSVAAQAEPRPSEKKSASSAR